MGLAKRAMICCLFVGLFWAGPAAVETHAQDATPSGDASDTKAKEKESGSAGLAEPQRKESQDSSEAKGSDHRRTVETEHVRGFPTIADLTAKWLNAEGLGEPWRPATSGPFVTFTAPVTDKGHLVLQPLFFYNFVRGTFDEDSHFHSLPKGDMRQTAVLSLFSQYGVLQDTEFDAQINLLHQRAKEGGERASSTGLGETQLALRTLLMHETPSWHPEIALIGQIKVPTGKFEHADPRELGTDIMGTGATDLTLGLDFTKGIKPFLLHADIWYTWPIATRVDDVHTRYGDIINWNVAVEIPFWRERLAYMLEFNGIHQANSRLSGAEISRSRVDQVIFGTGLEFIFKDNIQLLLGYQRMIWGTNTPATDTIGATLVWCF